MSMVFTGISIGLLRQQADHRTNGRSVSQPPWAGSCWDEYTPTLLSSAAVGQANVSKLNRRNQHFLFDLPFVLKMLN